MAIQTASVPRTDALATRVPDSVGLFGTGPAQPAEMHTAADLAVGPAGGVLGADPGRVPAAGAPVRS
ncbi:MAG: hypothetical protein JWP68_1958, partial [Modestobacter sp.]|nr:hypothetical protein [Modestobacter sp.]